MNFDTAFERLIGHEGGYVNDPADPGGETKFGISKRAHPGEDIPGMTLERAKAIYLAEYWGPAGCDSVPDAVKFPLFDFAVTSGAKTAAKALQRCVGAIPDGIVGPKTLMAVGEMDPTRLAARLHGQHLELMTRQPEWPRFGRGWAARVATDLQGV